jgi:ribonucleoside-triphosphate reductase
MRTIEEIESDLARAREALSRVEGRPAEVYSRIVGYYRSVRNWNRGKREEYGERKLFSVPETSVPETSVPEISVPEISVPETAPAESAGTGGGASRRGEEGRLLLFVRSSCPRCPGAKDAAGKLGIPVDLVDAGTEEGLAEAERRQVFSTPTAILLARDGRELGRALDAAGIGALAG